MVLLKLKAACRLGIKYLLLGCTGIIFLYACKVKEQPLPFYNTADFTAEWINKNDPRYLLIHTIDTFSFYNQSGHIINKDSLDGHIYVANFFFTTCSGICPRMVNNLGAVANAFSKNEQVKLVSFSVMPETDSVKRLYAYAQEHEINAKQWYLLTGNKEEINHLGRQSYFSERAPGLQKGSSDFLHTELMLLVDKQSRIRGVYNATDTNHIKRVIEDIKTLLNE
jgi:protein SCO1/2